MTNPKGTREESRLVTWFRAHGWPYARRLRQTGAKDEGDIALDDTAPVAIESKAVRQWDAAGWMKELEAEVANSGAEWGFVVVKKKGTQDPGEYYCVLPLKYLNRVMRRLYRPHQVNGPRRRVIRRTTV